MYELHTDVAFYASIPPHAHTVLTLIRPCVTQIRHATVLMWCAIFSRRLRTGPMLETIAKWIACLKRAAAKSTVSQRP